MAANLTPQYLKAEEAYRRAANPEEELAALQSMLKEMPKHKASEKLQADLKQKISRAKKEVESQKSSGGRGSSIRIPRQGAGTVVILGGANAGKSRLLAAVTRATPEVAPYPFTTRAPLPGMMPYEDILIQLIDTPPITDDYLEPYVQGLIRGADLTLWMVDLAADDGIEQCQAGMEKLAQTKTRLGPKTCLDEEDVGLSFTQTFVVPNKIDLPDAKDRLDLLHELCPIDLVEFVVSAETGTGLPELREAIYKALDVVRVYTKLPHVKGADMERPFTVRRGQTVLDVAEQVHKDFVEQFKFARVWGHGAHDAMVVKSDYVVNDRDIVELHK